jgi:hypothetical protein
MTTYSIVYVLTNPAMPNLVKIGRTSQEEAGSRIAQLYTTGVPVPFNLEYACRVQNSDEVEKALHLAFGPSRVNPKREFFSIAPEQAIAILKLLHTEDATATVSQQPTELDQQSISAGQTLISRRPNLNFHEMGIPDGSLLQSIHNKTAVMVIAPKRVKFEEEELSLTAATRIVLGIDYSVAPAQHWTFNAKLLSEIYNETYSNAE